MNKDSIRSCVIILLSSILLVSADETNLQHFTFQQFEKNLRSIESQKFAPKVSEQELTALRLRAADSSLPEDSWPAILQLWAIGEYDLVHLLWWQKDDSETRAFIVALDWCMVTVPKKNAEAWPGGVSNYEADAIRFEPTERDLRLRETEFVREHYSALAHELSVILSPSGIELAKRYEGFSKASGNRGASEAVRKPSP